MHNTTVGEAVWVLNAVQHRGARSWQYDERLARVMPREDCDFDVPGLTAFEACAVARRLTEIGACGKGREIGYAKTNEQRN
jgi:hypothetical protein